MEKSNVFSRVCIVQFYIVGDQLVAISAESVLQR